MANTNIAAKAEMTHTYQGVLQYDIGGGDTKQHKLIQDFSFTLNDVDTDRDFVDDADPVFTPVGDVIGVFNFTTKMAVSLFDTVQPPTNEETLTYWAYRASIKQFAEVDVIPVFRAPRSSGNQYGRLRLKCRVMSASFDRTRETGADEGVVSGEIIGYTSGLREAS